MRRSERTSAGRLGGGEAAVNTAGLFQFRLVDRLQCQQSGTVKYTATAADNLLSLQVPRHNAHGILRTYGLDAGNACYNAIVFEWVRGSQVVEYD